MIKNENCMKKILIVLLVFTTWAANAQFRYGVKAGVNIAGFQHGNT